MQVKPTTVEPGRKLLNVSVLHFFPFDQKGADETKTELMHTHKRKYLEISA